MRVAAAIATLLVVGLLAVLIPRMLLSDGMEQFTGVQRAAAEWAMSDAYQCLDNPIAYSLMSKVELISMEFQGLASEMQREPSSADGNHQPFPGMFPDVPLAGERYVAWFRAYTLFAIPALSIRVTSGGGAQCRWWQ
ncbi:MAG: hypothetical protein ACT4QA_20200 [Panacagrimonas sp.]